MAKLKMGAITDGTDMNQFCGPVVISAVTDLTTGEAARLIRKQNGRKAVTGTDATEVLKALRACNIKARRWSAPGVTLSRSTGPTLAAWLRMSKKDRTPGRVFLVSAGLHWQLVSGRRYTCGLVREIVSIKDKRVKRRARVDEVYELTSDHVTEPRWGVGTPRDVGERIDVSKPKSKSNPAYYKIKKLIQRHPEFGITYEKDDRFYWCLMSEELEQLATDMEHPLSDDHCCDYLREVGERVEEMVEFGKENYHRTIKDLDWMSE